MSNTFIHVFQNNIRLVLVVTQDVKGEHWNYSWVPELKSVDELEELEEEFLEWMDFHADLLMEEAFYKGLRFEATCGAEYELRHEQLSQLK